MGEILGAGVEMGGRMVPILDGSSETSAHVWVEIGNLISLRPLFRSGVERKFEFFSSEKKISFTWARHVLTYPLIQVPWAAVSVHTRLRRNLFLYSAHLTHTPHESILRHT